VITCDTRALLYWALAPERLSGEAVAALEEGRRERTLACADIVLWEIGQLAARGRIARHGDTKRFICDLIAALRLRVLPMEPDIAVLAHSALSPHKDPADPLIAATALYHRAPLISADEKLAAIRAIQTIW
jgi:PIN domain nuclease of toxin-antitoxin system